MDRLNPNGIAEKFYFRDMLNRCLASLLSKNHSSASSPVFLENPHTMQFWLTRYPSLQVIRTQQAFILEKHGIYNLYIISAKSASSLFENYNLTEFVNFYCLSTLHTACPQGFSVIQSLKEIRLRSPFVLVRPQDNAVHVEKQIYA